MNRMFGWRTCSCGLSIVIAVTPGRLETKPTRSGPSTLAAEASASASIAVRAMIVALRIRVRPSPVVGSMMWGVAQAVNRNGLVSIARCGHRAMDQIHRLDSGVAGVDRNVPNPLAAREAGQKPKCLRRRRSKRFRVRLPEGCASLHHRRSPWRSRPGPAQCRVPRSAARVCFGSKSR